MPEAPVAGQTPSNVGGPSLGCAHGLEREGDTERTAEKWSEELFYSLGAEGAKNGHWLRVLMSSGFEF